MIHSIELKNKDQVTRINRLACEAPYEVWLSDGDVLVDARSLLGLFVLLGRRVDVVVEDSVDPKRFARLVRRMA